MLDRYAIEVIRAPLHHSAKVLNKFSIRPNQVTLAGFALGLSVLPALAFEHYGLALIIILLNRIMDGLDGALARIQGPSDFGGYLDIVCDFIFYSAVVLGFALADPQANSLASATLIFCFMGTGSSFLAYAVMAAKRNIENPIYPHKSLYYLGGLTEGSETIAVFVIFCLLPNYFAPIALGFGALCVITTVTRILSAKATFQAQQV
ncbi:CDP-alcohol phosphatidyltransferase family protein [Alginatibacterium sediminis]|uniref:CDP-alcohol phosphatidyltransferase family protein n=1 Tax=Alginatibacterium sediminis TaxID=2164068 RepID=A0A420E6V3_9ALTE|nr:CDP-alcohol phosphatidyltransferase family protein [Alginatibacterium sediminis]RKF13765.1 CDP-alcohol phosphatidyltransferase family protein [Alginatibacterium sediminis]